ncbi:DUF7507 domain-containing protein [Microbacterium karelineae]|uniref:DUF7507 domain-containing protein n=1 Tax=Microbacterium karelineae TaxID=2654283 RepID=UPI0012EAF506|nr:LPXTG cell wall anchor domain-containing protein [Microbacterium karelineae]
MTRSRATAALTAFLLVVGVLVAPQAALAAAGEPTPASGEPEYEMTGRWVDEPDTVGRGEPVVAEWRINVNDSGTPAGNDLVENVTAVFDVGNAVFHDIPDVCLTDGVEPASSISEDGTTLTCNFGTVRMGTALVLQTPVVPTGTTGEEVTLTGGIDDQFVELPPVEILNDFAMDMYFGQNTEFQDWDEPTDPSSVIVNAQWTLRLGKGSDPGPDSVTYPLTVTSQDGSPVSVGAEPRAEYGQAVGCGPFNDWQSADGHPYSGRPEVPERNAPFVEECTLTQTGANTFELTLTGIDYSLLNVPTEDSSGNALPPDWDAIASGTLWFEVTTDEAGSISVVADPVTYEAPTGQTFVDPAGNNTTNKSYTLPGSWAASWGRAYTGSGGNYWDDAYRVPVGTEVEQRTTNRPGQGHAPDEVFGNCLVLDADYVTYTSTRVVGWDPSEGFTFEYGPGESADYQFEWFTGDTGDPDQFDCGSGTWTTEEPADPSAITAVRVTFDWARYAETASDRIVLYAYSTIDDDVQAGQDVWMFGSAMKGDDVWLGQNNTNVITPTPDARYPHTNGRRDILRVVTALPYIEKEAADSSVTVGVPADFTLTYAATGSALLPPTMDGFEIRDRLPVGMTYVAGSADPEPTISTDPQGRQILDWRIDGVETNVEHQLTYQAVADASVEPGTALTNTSWARMGATETQPNEGDWSAPSEATVTTTTNGHTSILKTSDVDYIPNVDGSGSGTGSWTVQLESFDPTPQGFTDTIDILPYNGDDRGTSFSGSYTLDDVVLQDGGTVYYTNADISTVSDDPADPSNGSAGDVTGNTVGWTTEPLADATAIRVIGGEFRSGDTFTFQIVIAVEDTVGEDVFWNSAQARAEHTELVMRTSAPLVIANYYAAELKKYVRDADGEWHDAQDVSDFPQYRAGDEVPYRIVIENTGQGTLTNVEITDDQQPAEGPFVIAELAPGATETFEYTMTLPADIGDEFVNTACATTDTPPDAEEPPTIDCDPAGIEVVGDPEHVKDILSTTPIGDGEWEIVYGITVSNPTAQSTAYTLADELRFTDEATVTSAEVTASPDGVTLAEPAWDGQGELVIAADVPLAGGDDEGYAEHAYEVTVVASVPLSIAGAGGDPDPTACGEDAGASLDRAFTNTTTLTDPLGETDEDWACAPIPSIDIVKTVAEGPVANGDGTWTVRYDIVASNSGAADGVYTVTDRMTADGDLTVESGSVVTTPEGVTANDAWTGMGEEHTSAENVIVEGVDLPAGEAHTYQVEVVLSLDTSDGVPVVTACSADGGDAAGGLSNAAQIEHNDLTDDAEACVTVTDITVDKTVSEGPTANGDGTWTVVYDVVATNVGPAAGTYDVYDQLRYGADVTLESADVVSGPDGVELSDEWTGLGDEPEAMENLVAGGVSLESGASHTYRVQAVVSLDEAQADPQTLVCPEPGSGEIGGLANGATLDHNGYVVTDEVCPTLPMIEIDKEIVDGPTENGDGTWTIVYELIATNVGAVEGVYDIADELRFGDGTVVEDASVTQSPDGVTLADPAWDGRDETVIAEGVSLDAGASHAYRVETIVSLDTEESEFTAVSMSCPEPGSGEDGGLANTVALTHNGEELTDEACAELPMIDIAKSLRGSVEPVEGEEGVYDATYEITVTNRGPGAGSYDLDDSLAVGEGVTVVGVQDVSTDAPDSVGINDGFGTDGDERIVTGQPIAGADGAPVVHTYTVTIRYALDLSQVGEPGASDSCTTDDGGVADGALHNVATVTWNGQADDDDECVVAGKPVLDKRVVSADPVGDGRWEVVYDLTVGNTGAAGTVYDLDDEFLFAADVTVIQTEVTGPEGVAIDESFDGEAHQRIATGVEIAGLDDEGYAPHVYRVTVLAEVPLRFADVAPDGTGSPACTAAPGDNWLEQGLNNAATLTDETGGEQTDTDCAPLPSILIDKSVVGDPTVNADGEWTIVYELVASNDGAAAGEYTLVDRLRYGAGIDVTSAAVASAPEGVDVADSWTGQGEDVIAEGVSLAAGASHTYRVEVTATIDGDAADASTYACPGPGTGEPGGFANTAGIAHNDLDADAEACASPAEPEAPGAPGGLPATGGSVSTALLAGGILTLLLGGGLVLLTIRRRRQEVVSDELS